MSADPHAAVPRFAVVGRVNKGKSSIVATLAEDEAIRIDPRPGTTVEVREFPVRVDGRTLFVLLDTPGFEDAPRALAWLRAREGSAAERPARVAELLRAFEGTDDLVEERRLLAPILAGAAILYVVDGGHPYRPNYEAEMEILRWTGRPRMALVNRIPDGAGAAPTAAQPGDHAEEWHRALDQFFRIVRDFDAQAVAFDERVGLLRAFRELEPAWREPVDEAVAALVGQRLRRRDEAAAEIADLLVDALTHHEEVEVGARQRAAARVELERRRESLEASFHAALRAREDAARRRIEVVYGHHGARFEQRGLDQPAFARDLFAAETWRLLGLSAGQLVGIGALAGAATGGGIDAGVGGASFGTGAVLGGAAGAYAAFRALRARHASARPVGLVEAARRLLSGVRRFRVGPHANPNFPWVLLDRALLHHDAVARRTHARRGTVPVEEGGAREGPVAALPRAERAELERLFRRLRRSFLDPPRELRDGLERALARVLARLDPVEGR